jgi:P-type E1-E2 ATPase
LPEVTLALGVPGLPALRLEHLLLDVNGTLTDRGTPLDGVEARVARLADQLEVRLVSADTFGTLDEVAEALGVESVRAATGEDKLRLLDQLGRERCAAIGNGANDTLALAAAAVGIAVLGPEGASASALAAADVVCPSVLDALDLLLDPRALSATLRP